MGMEIRKYAKLLLVMTTDFMMDAITAETYVSNIKIMVSQMEEIIRNHKAG